MEAALDRIVLLANARSTRYSEDLASRIEALRRCYDVQVVTIHEPVDFDKAIRDAGGHADAIFIASGDGTLARSAPALIDARRPVGVLPLGNANDLARGLGIPTTIESACESLCHVRRVRIEIGSVNGYTFFNAATVGLGAEISSSMDVHSKKRWRKLSHFPRFIKAVRERRAFDVRMTHDGGIETGQSIQLTVGNGRTIGGGIVVDEEARLDDGTFSVSSVPPQPFWSLLALAPDYIRGKRRGNPKIQTFRLTEFRLETSRSMDVATDGDIVTRTPARFERHPASLEFLVPLDPAIDPAVDGVDDR